MPTRWSRSSHLLAYLFDPGHPELAAETRRIRDDRVLRARAMVDRLVDLGVPISWDDVAAIAGTAVVGRPHIARAMAAERRHRLPRSGVHPGLDRRRRPRLRRPVRARPGPRDHPGPLGRRVAVLAHPRADRALQVSDAEIACLAAAGLAGVEVFHPDQPESEQASLLGLTRDLGLIATGGSDDHGSLTGHRIGSHTAAPGAYESLISLAKGAKGSTGSQGSQPVRDR